jgi:hypothetical protein
MEKFVVSGLSDRSKRNLPVAVRAIPGAQSLSDNPDTTNCFRVVDQLWGIFDCHWGWYTLFFYNKSLGGV